MHSLFDRRRLVACLLPCLVGLTLAGPVAAAERVFDVRDYGAKADGTALCTEAIQKAIDACTASGGGTVWLPPGTLRSGTLFLKNNVTLWLESGCVLLGSENLDDYPKQRSAVRSYTDNYVECSLIAGEDLENVALCGRGTINGNGTKFPGKKYLTRPFLLRLVRCRGVLVEGITLRDSAMWMQHYLACDRVTLRGVTVYNHTTYNADGVDIDGCHDVTITDCNFDSDDDGITLKSTLDRACENVTITNCIASSHCNAIKMGTETNGGFKNITISNCVVCSPRYSQHINGSQRGHSGLALEITDGGALDRVAVSNLTITGVSVPIFLRLNNRARPFVKGDPKPAMGTMRNVTISHVIATKVSRLGCSITGLPGHPIENVSLSDLEFSFEGGGTREDATREVPELPETYPDPTNFDKLPAYGCYCRHVTGLRVQNVRVRTTEPDLRHAWVCEDVAGLWLDGLTAGISPGAAPVVRLTQVQDALIRGCTLPTAVETFLQVQGPASRDIVLAGNDLRRAQQTVQTAADVPQDAVLQRDRDK